MPKEYVHVHGNAYSPSLQDVRTAAPTPTQANHADVIKL
jgi:hypothetical protein